MVYAVEIVESEETRLEPSTPVRMVLVPEVPHDVRGPTPAPGNGANSIVIETDMFAFLSAETGAHLASVYIGPAHAG